MIQITVNGQPHALAPGSSLADLIAELEIADSKLGTAVNQQFVARDARAARMLGEGDAVFTFQVITGG